MFVQTIKVWGMLATRFSTLMSDANAFNSAEKMLKITFLMEHGIFLKTVELGGNICNLYAIKNYYVKFKYKKAGDGNAEIAAFNCSFPLDRSINDIDLAKLF